MVIDITEKLKEKALTTSSKELVEKLSIQEFEPNPKTGKIEIDSELIAEMIFFIVDVAVFYNEE